MTASRFGDMDPESFRHEAHRLADWIADYLASSSRYPVLANVSPGQVRAQLPAEAPAAGETFDAVFADFERIILPGITHWNHPGFFAYFAITGSGPGILGEFLSAALNQQAMLWRTSPAATELEAVTLRWLQRLIRLPDEFEGVIYDTASISTLHALAAARERAVPQVRERGMAGRSELGMFRVYCSDQTHSSIDKSVILLGLGQSSLRKIPSDDQFRMRTDALRAAIEEDRRSGITPLAVVATIGSTSTTSIDPVDEIATLCAQQRVWLHVDAAYAGVAAMTTEYQHLLTAAATADSLVVNPHKWLFTPFDCSVLYCRHMDVLRSAFSLIPAYLQTNDPSVVKNLMDTGIQLGRRFRALKLWMVMRHFGASGLRERLSEHMRLARLFASWVDESREFERLAPVPFSVVCFRAIAAGGDEGDAINERVVELVNRSGEVFISHTRLNGRFAIRLAIGNLHTTEEHVRRAWTLLNGAVIEASRLH
ncbi:MAG TPA: aminotransferase class I/II-fold pyridoxal phosphate-dependent enzyme [Vicinamibacterales bacterium]|nr:aminotransferase class I/II-fold pyridoxal phosphate-dependent enzyme [Vicinamibacterales bacterium]